MPIIAPTALPTTPPVKQIRKRFDSSSSAQTTAPQKASRNSTKLIISAGSVAFLKDVFSLSFADFFEKTGFFSDKTQKESVSALSFIVWFYSWIFLTQPILDSWRYLWKSEQLEESYRKEQGTSKQQGPSYSLQITVFWHWRKNKSAERRTE